MDAATEMFKEDGASDGFSHTDNAKNMQTGCMRWKIKTVAPYTPTVGPRACAEVFAEAREVQCMWA